MVVGQIRKLKFVWRHSYVMDYKPRHPQPFTLAQATALDVSVISEGRVEILKGKAIMIDS